MNRNIILGQPDSEIPTFRKRYDEAVKRVATSIAHLAAGSRRKEIRDLQLSIGSIAREYFDLLDRSNALALRRDRAAATQVGVVASFAVRQRFEEAAQAYEEQAAARLAEAKAASLAEAEQMRRVLIGTAMAGLLAAVGLSLAIVTFGVTRPLSRLVAALQHMAQGEIDASIDEAKRGDEIGAVGRAVEAIKAVMVARNAAEEIELKRAAEAQSVAERKRTMMELAKSFELAVAGIVRKVSVAAHELQNTARQMTATAQETASQSTMVAGAAEQTAANIDTVAAATEQLNSSIQEIGRQASGSSNLSLRAVNEAEQTAGLVTQLNAAVEQIGDVVRLIASIANQTNLLALNATIEAARAGEAGRGFAIVAAEVKALAGQTAQATAGISEQIGRIQGASGEAAEAIGTITSRIRTISGLAGSIAAAVEEQGAATQEIVRNIAQASMGTQEVTGNIFGVAESSERTGSAADQVFEAASDLSQQFTQLSNEVERFLAIVRAA